MDGHNKRHSYGPGTAQELCHAVSDLGNEVGEAIETIMQKRSQITPIVVGVICGYRDIIYGLLQQAQKQYQSDSEEIQIVELAQKKTTRYLKEYNYYSLIADVFEREKVIKEIQRGLRYLRHPQNDLQGRTKQAYLFLTYWIRKGALSGQMQKIVGEIERVIQDDHFHGLKGPERRLFQKKWKHYVRKSQIYGITL